MLIASSRVPEPRVRSLARARTSDLCVVAANLWVRDERSYEKDIVEEARRDARKNRKESRWRREARGRLVCAAILTAFPLTPRLRRIAGTRVKNTRKRRRLSLPSRYLVTLLS